MEARRSLTSIGDVLGVHGVGHLRAARAREEEADHVRRTAHLLLEVLGKRVIHEEQQPRMVSSAAAPATAPAIAPAIALAAAPATAPTTAPAAALSAAPAAGLRPRLRPRVAIGGSQEPT